MTRFILVVIAGGLLFFSGCAENGSNDEDSLAELGARCERDQDCRRGVCSDDICAMPALDCVDSEDCLSWEMCMNDTCTDPCVLMNCAENFTCERGECVPISGCDGGECEPCENLMDCDAYSVCEDGICVSNGDCEPWFVGWFVNAAGACEEGGKSGCNYPFDFTSEEECEASLNAGGLTECPEDSDVFFGDGDRPTAAKALNCEYGSECCCGECHPSTVCYADAGQTFGCYATDACMIQSCACTADDDCALSEACDSGWCFDVCGDADCGEGQICRHGHCLAEGSCELIDCAEGYECLAGKCLPVSACDAYWEGAIYAFDLCIPGSTSGCSNPFPYESVAQCCDANSDAGGCDADEACTVHEDCSDNYHYCEEGVCVHNGDCDAEFDGWYVDGNGDCNRGVVSGCESPFPYSSELACCAANDGACGPMSDDEKACVNAGGDWELFNDSCADGCGMLERPCARVLTMSCDCGPDACWDGEQCLGSTGGECKDDSECPEGTVCESGLDGAPVCAAGCHGDGDCLGGEVCNTEINCFAPPCPGLCESLAQNNCGDRSCDAESAYCQKSYGGVRPPQGSGITYACQDLPADCSEVPSEKLCDCLMEGPSGAGMDCSVSESGIATVSVYLP